MFPLEAIVLKKLHIDSNRVVITCFSSEYGKIDIFYKESLGSIKLDTLSHFTGQIRTKEKNSLTQIYRTTPFITSGTYDLYEIAGWSVSVLYSLLPSGLPYPRLFQLLKHLTYNRSSEQTEFLTFILHICHDFGIAKCDIRDYLSLLENPDGHQTVRSELENWISAYRAS